MEQFSQNPIPPFFDAVNKAKLVTSLVARFELEDLTPELKQTYFTLVSPGKKMNSLTNLLLNELHLHNDSKDQNASSKSSEPNSDQQKSTQIPSVADLTQMISKLDDPISEKDISETLIILSNNKPWDGVLVGSALKSASNLTGINWDNVCDHLEESLHYGENIYTFRTDPQSLFNLLTTFSSIDDVIISKFYNYTWKNFQFQLDISLSSFYVSPNLFNFQEHGLDPVLTTKIFMDAPENVKIRASVLLYHSFNIATIIHKFLDLVSKENGHGNATALLDAHGKEFPELFFFGSFTMPQPRHPIIDRVIENLFDLALLGHVNNELLFYAFPFFDKSLLLQRLFNAYNKDPLNIQCIFEAAKSARVIQDLLAIDHPVFTLEIASTADKQHLISFSAFLKDKLDSGGPTFAGELIDFLELKASIEYTRNQNGCSPPGLSLRTVSTAIQLLNSTNLSGPRAEQYKSVQIQCLQSYPRLINFGFTQEHDRIILSHTESNTFSPDVEFEMKRHYQRMYEQQIEIRDIITMLQRLKQSTDPRDQDVFACMIHSLFDEYRFFPEYPLNALATTAVLFGSLIYFQLIDGTPLSIALRFILDSLRQPPDSNMFKFGLQALVEFRERLAEFPKYCHRLLEIPGLRMHPNFYQQINDIATLPNANSVAMLGNGDSREEEIMFTSINFKIHIPNEVRQEDPSGSIKESVMFAVNNLAPDNLKDKASKITAALDDKYLQWFASYIVGQRAKQEPNYHKLYIDLITILNYRHLEYYIFQFTYYEIARLANDPDVNESMDKRKFLKNLGQLLGSFSLERNKPILHKNISFKMLLCEAFSQGKLRAIIPFVCKILDRSSSSIVFTPENPWINGILKVLVELYQFVDLALPNKFEIEVLFKELGIEMKDIEPSFIIRNYLAQHGVESQGAQLVSGTSTKRGGSMGNANAISVSPASQNVVSGIPDEISIAANAAHNLNQQQFQAQQLQLAQQSQQQLQLQQQAQQQQQQPLLSVSFNPEPYLQLASRLEVVGQSQFALHPAMKELFHLAVENVAKETFVVIVDRSVAIATISARSLLLKDFACEVDESKLRLAAHNLVKNLAGNLALASAKDLVKDSLATTLRNLLISRGGFNESNYPSDQISLAINDNIDNICKVIEQATVDRAVVRMDEILLSEYQARQQFKESGSTQPFASNVDPYALHLPDPFKLKPTGLDLQQFSIYLNFGSARPVPDNILGTPGSMLPTQRQNQTQLNLQQQIGQDQPQSGLDDISSADQAPLPALGGAKPGAIPFEYQDPQTLEQIFERALLKVQADIENIIKLAHESSVTSLSKLPSDDPILTTFAAIANTIATTVQSAPIAEFFVEKLTQYALHTLFSESLNQLASDALGLLLVRFCEASPITGREVILWIFMTDDPKKYKISPLVTVVKCGLITWAEFDFYLSKKMNEDEMVKFACDLITETVLKPEPAYAFRADFAFTLEALEPLATERPSQVDGEQPLPPNKHVVELLESLEKHTLTVDGAGVSLTKQMNHIFAEWVHLVDRPGSQQKFLDSFIYQLSKRNILSDDSLVTLLIRTATTTSIKEYNRSINTQHQHPTLSNVNVSVEPYAIIDSLSLLLAKIVKNSSGMDEQKRTTYIKTLFSVITLMICNDHEKLKDFPARPYFRLINSFLAGLHEDATDDEPIGNIYLLLAEAFQILQPIAVPGFTFSWVSLISSRYFMPSLLLLPEKKGFQPMVKLLTALLRFQSLYAQGTEFPQSIASIYKGTLKIFYALVNDFPDFILENHWTLLKNMPSSFVQLRNLVLSTFPQTMQLPNPLAQGLKVDRLPEIKENPPIAEDPAEELTICGLKSLIDKYLESPNPAIIKGISSGLVLATPKEESGIGFSTVTMDSAVINALVLYIVMDACKKPLDPSSSPQFNRDSAHLSLLSNLLLQLNVEGQYFLCEAMANHLRYPNRHTHFCSCVFLSFFGNYGTSTFGDQKESICHLITRVLLERIISNRPHPWGLVITFTELLRNSNYKFSELKFTKEYGDIEHMFTLLYDRISGSNASGQINDISIAVGNTGGAPAKPAVQSAAVGSESVTA